jgi:GMP synthase PP-ATPase subunit
VTLRRAGDPIEGCATRAFIALFRKRPQRLPARSVGVAGDGRTYADTAAIRCHYRRFRDRGSARLFYDICWPAPAILVNEVGGVNRRLHKFSRPYHRMGVDA